MDCEKCRNKALKTAAEVKGNHHLNHYIYLNYGFKLWAATAIGTTILRILKSSQQYPNYNFDRIDYILP